LGISEDQLRALARRGELPAVMLREDWWFDREDILDWATSNAIDVSEQLFPSSEMPAAVAENELAGWLRRGGVHVDVECSDAESLLTEVVKRLPLADEDREIVFEALLTRERMTSSGLGQGIAIPHVHDPLIVTGAEPTLGVFFPKHPVPFGAFDDRPIHTFFCLLSPNTRLHQRVLSRLAGAMHDAEFVDALGRHDGDALIEIAARLPEHHGQQGAASGL
jgi:PTS system nitrogen regulatory IIA component